VLSSLQSHKVTIVRNMNGFRMVNKVQIVGILSQEEEVILKTCHYLALLFNKNVQTSRLNVMRVILWIRMESLIVTVT